MDEKEIRKRLGRPDRTINRKERMRSRAWLCSSCGAVAVSLDPVPIPAPCPKCGGIFFEAIEQPLQ